MTTLADALNEYAPDHAAPGSVADVAIRRAFMAGALETLSLLKAGATREQLLAECVQFGRAVGTAAEKAQA